MEKLMSVDEVAETLGVPKATVYRWQYRREGPPAYRVGKYLKFRPADLERWLAERQAEKAS